MTTHMFSSCPLSPRQFPRLQIPKHARESLPLDRATLRFDILQVVKEGVANEARSVWSMGGSQNGMVS
jgi:hypothetical protein